MKNFWLDNHTFFLKNNFKEIEKLIQNYSSPAYIYSKEVIRSQYISLKEFFPSNVKIFYAQKSNPNPEILKFISSLGGGCDTASEGEINNAINAGFKSDNIMMTGPAKTHSEIECAVNNNLLSINAESLQEILLINKIASSIGKKQNILIRINPRFEAGEGNRIIGGMGVSKFGIDIDQIPEVFKKAKTLENISIKGIHIFNSSQILDTERIIENTKNVLDTAINLSKEYKIEFEYIDAGGGFGIPYSQDEKKLNIEKLGNSLNDLFNTSEYKNFINSTNLIFEPGRFISGECGIYIFKVLYTKTSGGKNIALTDGGVHHLLRPVLIGQIHPILNLTALSQKREKKEKYIVAGPLCTSLDEFDDSAELNEVIQGDILAVLNAGAYGYTESMPLFLSHKPAKEIFIN